MRTVRAASLVKSHSHTHVGIESSLVAIRLPAALKATVEMPDFEVVSDNPAGATGGETGCGTNAYSRVADNCSCQTSPAESCTTDVWSRNTVGEN